VTHDSPKTKTAINYKLTLPRTSHRTTKYMAFYSPHLLVDLFPFFKQRKNKAYFSRILLTFMKDRKDALETHLFVISICLFFMWWWWQCIKPLELLCASSLKLLRKLISVLLCYFFSGSSITSMSFSNVI